jgi:hypothetical protein
MNLESAVHVKVFHAQRDAGWGTVLDIAGTAAQTPSSTNNIRQTGHI